MQEVIWGSLPIYKNTKCIVVDLDSTLCNNDHRASLIPSADKNVEYEKVEDRNTWEKFFLAAEHDGVYECVASLIGAMRHTHNIVIMTAREHKYSECSFNWLAKNGIDFGVMLHKPDGCKMSALDYKIATLPLIEKEFGKIQFCLDDQTAIVRAMRAAGYIAFDVRNAYND